MALCAQIDVEHRLQVTFDDPADPTVAALIDAATGLIQDHTDQHLEDQPALEVTLDGSGAAWVFLHEIPVRAVTALSEDGTVLTEGVDDDFVSYVDGRLLRRGGRWTRKPQSIEVTYDAGYDTIPETLVAVCAAMVARALIAGAQFLTDPDDEQTKVSESKGNYSVTYQDVPVDVAMAHLYVTDEDAKALGPYRMEAFG